MTRHIFDDGNTAIVKSEKTQPARTSWWACESREAFQAAFAAEWPRLKQVTATVQHSEPEDALIRRRRSAE